MPGLETVGVTNAWQCLLRHERVRLAAEGRAEPPGTPPIPPPLLPQSPILTALHLMLSKLQLEESGADPASGLQAGLATSPIQPARPDRLGPSQLATATGSFHMSKPVERIPSFSRQSGRLVSVTL